MNASDEGVRRVTCVAASVQAAHIHDHGLRSLSFDLQRRYERIFSVNDNSVRVPFDFKSDSELPRHFFAFLRLGYERALTGMDPCFACELGAFVPGRCRVAAHSTPPQMH
jgi:hypothetical protein